MSEKSCPEGYVLNSQTGRCVKIGGATHKKLLKEQEGIRYSGVCPEYYVLNPLTGKCIQSEDLMHQKKVQRSEQRKEFPYSGVCPETYVWNPSTGRCNKQKQPSAGRGKSEYNMFVSKALQQLKAQYPDAAPKDRLSMAAKMWRDSKSQ